MSAGDRSPLDRRWVERHPSNLNHILEVTGVTVRYGPVLAVDRASMSAACGAAVALVGPNGAGKSSLLKALAGVVRAAEGRMRWRGLPLRKCVAEVAYLAQREEVDWDFPLTVRGLVEMGRYAHTGWWRPFGRRDRSQVEHALATMGLAELAERQIGELSGGQQQRAFLARAIAQEAHVLLLDEPFTGLDQPAQADLGELIRAMTREGRLVVATHHDLATVGDLFDDVVLLNTQVVARGSAVEVMRDEPLRACYGDRWRALSGWSAWRVARGRTAGSGATGTLDGLEAEDGQPGSGEGGARTEARA